MEVCLESTEVVAVAFRICDSNESLQSVSAGRNPAAIDIRVRAKNCLRLKHVNVIEVKNNESAMVSDSFVRSRRKLPAEAYDRKVCLGLLVAFTNLVNRRLRIAILDSR